MHYNVSLLNASAQILRSSICLRPDRQFVACTRHVVDIMTLIFLALQVHQDCQREDRDGVPLLGHTRTVKPWQACKASSAVQNTFLVTTCPCPVPLRSDSHVASAHRDKCRSASAHHIIECAMRIHAHTTHLMHVLENCLVCTIMSKFDVVE